MSGHGHGLAQGPLASDFLAECFLLPIDLELQADPGYVRYVDDIRFLGTTESVVRKNVIELEHRCRERGLIPQTGKFAIKRAQNIQEALGMLPSISDPQHHEGSETLDKERAQELLSLAIGGKPQKVLDKTRLRYVLYRAEPESSVLKLVLRLIPRHPEHADVFFVYLNRFDYRKPIEHLCLDIIERNPYAYVRGEAWHVLARYRREVRSAVYNHEGLTNEAIEIAKRNVTEGFMEQWGACHFLCASEDVIGRRFTKFVTYQKPLLQSLLAPVLPDGAFEHGQLVEKYLRRKKPEPGLSVCPAMHQRGLTPASLGVRIDDLAEQVVNTLHELGVVPTPSKPVDPIAEILQARYELPKARSWHELLGAEYGHALGLLKEAEATFDVGRSHWLSSQNGFNQILFHALQRHLAATSHVAAGSITDKNGQLLDFGVTLDATRKFSKQFPRIADCFREMNDRRNRLPGTHPYEKKTGKQSRHLDKKERNRFVEMLQTAYADLSEQMQ